MVVKHKPTRKVHKGIKGGKTGCGVDTNKHLEHWLILTNVLPVIRMVVKTKL